MPVVSKSVSKISPGLPRVGVPTLGNLGPRAVPGSVTKPATSAPTRITVTGLITAIGCIRTLVTILSVGRRYLRTSRGDVDINHAAGHALGTGRRPLDKRPSDIGKPTDGYCPPPVHNLTITEQSAADDP